MLSTDHQEARRIAAWETLCLESAWFCSHCGAIPEVGKLFERSLCDACRGSLKEEEPSEAVELSPRSLTSRLSNVFSRLSPTGPALQLKSK